jgi:hypothetical protein
MRVVGEIEHPIFKITVFAWNGKYVVKMEKGNLEQIFKIPDYDLLEGEQSLQTLFTPEFYHGVEERFRQMQHDLNKLLE